MCAYGAYDFVRFFQAVVKEELEPASLQAENDLENTANNDNSCEPSKVSVFS